MAQYYGNGDPQDPLLALLHAKVAAAPSSQQFVHRAPNMAQGPIMGSLTPFFTELFGMPANFGSTSMTTGATNAQGEPIDLTDPAVHPGDAKLTPMDQFVRKSRVLARAMRMSFGTNAGVTREQMEGGLTPADDKERMIYQFAPMLAAMGILAPAGPLAEGLEAATPGAAMGASAGAEAILSGARAAPAAAPSFGFGGLMAQMIKGGAVGAAAGAPYGALGGLAESALPGNEGRRTEMMIEGAKDMAKQGALLGAGTSALGYGAMALYTKFFDRPNLTPVQRAQAAAVVQAVSEGEMPPIVPGPGMEIDGKQAFMTKEGLKWRRWDEKEQRWNETEKPSDRDIQMYGKDQLQKMQQRTDASPEGQAMKAAAREIDPLNPQTLPMDLRAQALRGITIGADYFIKQGDAITDEMNASPSFGKIVLQRRIQNLQDMLLDPTLSPEERITMDGRIMALQKVLKVQEVSRQGLPSLDTEIAAINFIRSIQGPMGSEAAQHLAAELELNGQMELGQRIRELSRTGIPDNVNALVTSREDAFNKAKYKGVRRGSKMIGTDGKTYQILDKVGSGLVAVRDLTAEGGSVDYKGVEELQPYPRAGKTARTKDGKIVTVQGVIPDRNVVDVTDTQSGQRMPMPIGNLKEISDDPATAREHEFEQAFIKDKGVPMQPVTPTKATTTTGEPVTITESGQGKVKVRTAKGGEKTLNKEEVVRSSADKPGLNPAHIQQSFDLGVKGGTRNPYVENSPPWQAFEAGKNARQFDPETQKAVAGRVLRSLNEQFGEQPQIVNFHKGTIPEEGNKILFFRVPKGQVAEFEQLHNSGKMDEAALRRLVTDRATPKGNLVMTPHVLPPDQMGQHSIYGLEIPTSATPMKNYSDLAKNALKALRGESTVGSYLSPVDVAPSDFLKGRIFRIPDEQLAAIQQPKEMMQFQDQGEHTSYLRNLINMNEQVNHEYAQHAAESREAHEKSAVAFEGNDGDAFVEAEAERAEAMKDAADALLDDEFNSAFVKQTGEAVEQVIAENDEDAAIRQAFEQQGVTDQTRPFWYRELDQLPPAPYGTLPDEYGVAPSKAVDGGSARIYSRSVPRVVRTDKGLQPTVGKEYEVHPIDSNRQVVRSQVRRFDTPQQVEQWLDKNGYAKTLLKQFSAQFEHTTKPGWVVNVRAIPEGGYQALQQQRVEVPFPHEMEQGGEAYSPAEQKIVAQLAKRGIIANAGETVFIPQGNLHFESMAAAEEGLNNLGYERSGNKHDVSLSKRFKELPSTDTFQNLIEGKQKARINATKVVTKTTKSGKVYRSEVPVTRDASPFEALQHIEDRLQSIVEDAVRLQNHVPDPIIDYAYEFAKVYDKVMDRPPFDRTTRAALGLPALSDMGPQEPRSIDISDAPLPNVPYQKGYGAPSPKVEHYGDQPGDVISVGDHLDIQHVMHLSGSDEGMVIPQEPTEPRTLYASVLRGPDEGPTFANLDKAVYEIKKDAILSKYTEAYNKAVQLPQDAQSQFAPHKASVGRYLPTQQAVQIVSVDPTGGEMRIRSSDGKEMNVDPKLVEPANLKTGPELGRQFQLQTVAMEGRYDQVFRREPPIGYGKVEQSLGLLGSTDRLMLNQAIATRANELASQLWGKGESLEGPQAAVNELLDLYNRSKWIKGETPIPLAEKGITLDTEQHVLNAIRAVDPALEKPFRYAAYRRARAAANNSPYGDLRAQVALAQEFKAKAAAGLLDEGQMKAIESWRRKLELSPNIPPERVVDELAARRLLNQHIGRMAQAMRSVLGFMKWADDAELPGNVKIRMPANNSSEFWPTWASIPWKMFRKNPMTQMLMSSVEAAQTREQLYTRSFKDMVTDVLQQAKGNLKLGYKSPDSEALRIALGKYTTLEEAQKGGLAPKYEYAFDRFRKYLDNAKYDHIRYFLQRQINPVPVTKAQILGDRKLQMFLEKKGIDTNKIRDGFMVLHKYYEDDLPALRGEERSSWGHDKIESFISTLKRYESAEQLPEGTDPDFVKDFDFWKRYGRDNYYPHIHQGSIMLESAQNGQLLAWAPSIVDAARAHRALVESGKISAGEDVNYVNHIPYEADDVLSRSMIKMKRRDWERMTRIMSEHIQGEGEQIKSMILKQYGPREQPAATPRTLVSAKPRTANLEPLFPDLMQDMNYYVSRLARNQYQWDVAQASQRFLYNPRLDESIATKFNQQSLRSMPQLYNAAKDYVRRATGEYTSMERFADNIYMMSRWAQEVPTELFHKYIKGDSQLPLGEIFNPNTYHLKYGAKGAASNWIGFQAFRKLMGNPMSALVNYLQYQMNTVPLAMGEGENPVKALARAERAWADGHRMWYANTFGREMPEQYKGIYPLLKEIGVDLMPSKEVAGGNFGSVVGQLPTGAGKTLGQYGGDLGKWALMLPFNGGEQIGRFATAIMAIQRQLEKEGVDWRSEAAVRANPAAAQRASVAAKRLVDKTFFHYDDLGMPSAFSNFGSLGRLAFQFKPFILQQMGYEKDLLMDMIHGKEGAAAKFGGHMAITSVMGGLTGLAYHPVISTVTGLIHLLTNKSTANLMGHTVPLTPEALEAMIAQRRSNLMTPEEQYAQSPGYRADDMLFYGLPAFFHQSMGSRVGISGQDVMPDFNSFGGFIASAAGPTFGMMPSFVNAWTSYFQSKGSTKGVLGGLAGAVAMQQLTRAIGGGPALPMSGMVGSILGGSLATANARNSLYDFMTTQKEGREALMQMTSGELRNGWKTWELMTHGYITNMNGEREYFPAENLHQEAMALAFGSTSIAREEYQAMMSFEAAENARVQHDTQVFTKEIAAAEATGTAEGHARAWEIQIKAQQLGIYISDDAIQDELENLTTEAINTMMKKRSVMTRWMAPGAPTEPLEEEKPEGEGGGTEQQ